MDSIDKLTEIFKEFPGIGERQARRFVYFLMSRNDTYSENIVRLIGELKKEVAQCGECFRFFILRDKKEKLCEICSDVHTDSTLLMVVEKDSDLESVKKSRVYHGKYFVLGGLVPVVEKTTKSRVRIEELKNKIKKSEGLKEVILAFSLNPQGDYTDQYIREQLSSAVEPLEVKISSLGRGLSTGTELEYSDNDTLKNALKNRQ
jgi:recombination protein RecR